MKIFGAIVVALLGTSAFAADCPSQIECGVFEGAGAWYDVNGHTKKDREYNERLEFNGIDTNHVNVKAYIYKGATPGQPWADAMMTFESDGRVSIDADGKVVALGICANKTCNIAFRPAHVTDGGQDFMNVFANIIRFEGNKLKRFNMVSNNSNDSDLVFQRSTLTKK